MREERVKEYTVELADGSELISTTVVYMDFELLTDVGSTILKEVRCNVLPGPIAIILLGQHELRRLGVTPIDDLVHKAIRKRALNKARRGTRLRPVAELVEVDGAMQMPEKGESGETKQVTLEPVEPPDIGFNRSYASFQDEEWKRRRAENTKGEPNSLAYLDDFHGHGKPAPDQSEITREIHASLKKG